MEFYQPRTELYKRVTEDPMKLKIYVDVRVRAGKKLTKNPATDPLILQSRTYLRYVIEDDASKASEYFAHFEEEFNWNGESHTVETFIKDGGTAINLTDNAEPY